MTTVDQWRAIVAAMPVDEAAEILALTAAAIGDTDARPTPEGLRRLPRAARTASEAAAMRAAGAALLARRMAALDDAEAAPLVMRLRRQLRTVQAGADALLAHLRAVMTERDRLLAARRRLL